MKTTSYSCQILLKFQHLTPMFIIQPLSPFWDKWILVTSFFYIFSSDLFQYYSTVTKFLVWTVTLKSSGKKFQWARGLRYMYHKCSIFRLPWIWTVIISECTFYDALLNVISRFSHYILKFTGQIFSPATPTHVTPLLWKNS